MAQLEAHLNTNQKVVGSNPTGCTNNLKEMEIKDILLDYKPAPEELERFKKIWVQGWVRTVRSYKKISFLEIYDGSTFTGLQIVVPKDVSDLKDITTGCSVEVDGELVESKGGEQYVELLATKVQLKSTCDPETYPLQKKEHSMEFFREHDHLRARTKLFQAVFQIRSGLSLYLHQKFQEFGFIHWHSPILSTSDCEGAGETFKLEDKEFFGEETHLTISGQIEAEYGALGLGKVYTFGPTFRAERSFTSKHLSEFWMLEAEASYHSMDDVIILAETILKSCVSYVSLEFSDQIDYLVELRPELEQTLEMCKKPFTRITYHEAIKICELHPGDDIDSESEKLLIATLQSPVIITDFLQDMKAFYMKQGPEYTVKGFDIIFPEVGELVGGSEREDNYDALVSRIKELELDESDYKKYLDTRKYGSVQHSGFGIGFDRLVMCLTGIKNIRDVIPYPKSAK